MKSWKTKSKYCTPILLNIIFTISSFKSSPFSKMLNEHDSSMFIYFGKGMKEGLIPYKDMFDHKGIVLFWIQQLGVKLNFGYYFTGIWVMEVIFYVISILFLYKTLNFLSDRKIINSLIILLITPLTITAISYGNYSEEYAFTFISIALFYFVKNFFQRDNSKVTLFIIGVTGALTFFIRPNMIALWVVFCCYLLILRIKNKEYQQLLKQTTFIFLGGLLVTLVILIYSLMTNNLHDMIQQTFILNVKYSNVITLTERLKTSLLFIIYSFQVGILPFFLLFILFLKKLKFSTQSISLKFKIIVLVYTLFNFITVILSGRYYHHYFVTMIPCSILIVGIVIHDLYQLHLYRKYLTISLGTLSVIPIVCFCAVFFLKVVPILKHSPNQNNMSEAALTAKYIKKNSTERDKIYVHNIDANIYLLSNRFSNSKFFVLPSLNYTNFPEFQKVFANNLYNKSPKFIVIKKDTYHSKKINNEKMDKIVISVIKKYYVKNTEVNSSNFLLFEKK